MDLAPREEIFTERDHHIHKLAAAARLAAISAEVRRRDLSQRPEGWVFDETTELAVQYSAVLASLRSEAKNIDPAQFSSENAQCLEAHATDWCAYRSNSSEQTPECRYVFRTLQIQQFTRFPHNEIHSVHEGIEIRWTDGSTGFASTPEILADLYQDKLVIPAATVETPAQVLPINTSHTEQQSQLEDFLTTVMEALVAKLRINNPAHRQLTFDD